jgi:hypothetical protein
VVFLNPLKSPSKPAPLREIKKILSNLVLCRLASKSPSRMNRTDATSEILKRSIARIGKISR